jgi:uncharacterized protein (DUF1800 family)
MKDIFFILLLTCTILSLRQGVAQSTGTTPENKVSISLQQTKMYERWQAPGTVIIRRSGGVNAITVPFRLTGTAISGTDYLTTLGASVTIPMGCREVWLQFQPVKDNIAEGIETVAIKLLPSSGYSLQGKDSATLTIIDYAAMPADEEVARFLIQAGFGADPDEVADVKALGFEGWMNAQMQRPASYLQPPIEAKALAGLPIYDTETKIALWSQIMRRRYPPGNSPVETDILRHRIAYSLLQIFVISQKVDELSANSEGVANYYDMLMNHAFGNFRNLLLDVALHPCMGTYLSHRGNQKADSANNIFPDQNFAREIMQLFSIGLWELNIDGTRKLRNGRPIPTYNNKDIAEFSRVFTGLNFGGPWYDSTNFYWAQSDYTHPMMPYEAFHDRGTKVLLRNTVLPAGKSVLEDVNGAIDNLFYHPNTGPFICRQPIQRLITSNPTPAYVARVARVFNNNGQQVRGDMGAVVKAILLDEEARDFSYTTQPDFGKMREPYMNMFYMAKTFNAQPESDNYDECPRWQYDFFLQEPFNSPSVFNFYIPEYAPPGEVSSSQKKAPEFQILNSITTINAQNQMKWMFEWQVVWTENPENAMILDFTEELELVNDPDALVRKLVSKMTGTPLNPKVFQIITEAVKKIEPYGDYWQKDRVNMAAYLIGASTDYNIFK